MNIFGDTIYKYNWSDAISKGYINDFEIVLPTSDYTAIKFEEFMELFKIEKKDNMNDPSICKYIRKMFFLIRSMLFNGNKRCIVFIPTIEMARECESIITWMKGMFNIGVNTAVIDYTTTKKDRKNIINNFATDCKINILLNVHVLDEGINIPQCDSVFITNPSNDLGNIVQRMSRCNRVLVGKGRSTVYIWCGNTKMDKIIGYINDCTGNELANKVAQVNIYQRNTTKTNNISLVNIKKPNINIKDMAIVGRSRRQVLRPSIDKDILELFNMNDGVGGDLIGKISNRINILGISKNKIDEYMKDIIQDDKKFIDFVSMVMFLDEKKGNEIALRDYSNEYKFSIIYAKIKKYKEITSVLKIRNNIWFNYDTYSKRFDTPIKDTNILADTESIIKLFKFHNTKYNGFDIKGGYERLYILAINMCRHMFGNDMFVTRVVDYRNKGERGKIVKHYLNEPFLQNITEYTKHIAVYQP